MPELGALQPDLPGHGHDGLLTADGVYYSEGGYRPMKAAAEFTAALAATWKGGGYFKGSGGNNKLLAGTDSGLNEYTSGAWALDFAAARTAQWFFAQFGDVVISVAGGAPVKYTLATSTGALLGGTPPSATMVAVVDPGFVFMAGNPSFTNRVYWSGLEAPETWTVGTSQSDVQDLPDGGEVTGIAGGEYGIVFQTDAIHLFQYLGGSVIFERRKISSQVGAVCHGSIAQAGHKTFFLHRRGFYVLEGGQLREIGKGRIDRTFFATHSLEDVITDLRATVDPDRDLVIWSMPGKLWIYNYRLDRWTTVTIQSLLGVATAAVAGLSPDDASFPSALDLDALSISLDDPSLQGGYPLLIVALTDNKLHTLSGSNLAATFLLPQIEANPGRETHVRNFRLIGDPVGATISIEARRRLADSPVASQSSDFRDNGDIPIRSSGRYIQPLVSVPAGAVWNYLQGYDIQASAGGSL